MTSEVLHVLKILGAHRLKVAALPKEMKMYGHVKICVKRSEWRYS